MVLLQLSARVALLSLMVNLIGLSHCCPLRHPTSLHLSGQNDRREVDILVKRGPAASATNFLSRINGHLGAEWPLYLGVTKLFTNVAKKEKVYTE
jgi:hypothetical protein